VEKQDQRQPSAADPVKLERVLTIPACGPVELDGIDWTGASAGFNIGQETGFGAVIGKSDHITIPQVYICDPLPVYVGAVGAGVDNPKSISMSLDSGMPSGNSRQVFVEADLARRVSADFYGKLGKILDLPFQWALDVNQLDADVWHLGHILCLHVSYLRLR
jgi:hypothetical protein